jgi:integrase
VASIKSRETSRGPRYDVRYRLPTGEVRTKTFRTKKEAVNFANITEADKTRGELIDPRAGKVTFASYAADWLEHRPKLRPRTVDLYRDLLDRHLLPDLGRYELSQITPEVVRRWHAGRIKAVNARKAEAERTGNAKVRTGETTVAKSYRLLRAILNTAAEDGRIVSNPCRIKGAGKESAPERPTASPAEVLALADAIAAGHERPEVASGYRCIVLLGGICGLRLGEVLGLAVRHVDLLHGTLTVERQLQELGSTGAATLTDPKTDAGRRVVPLPASIAAELRRHLEHVGPTDPAAFLFTGEKGGPLRRCVWQKQWNKARTATGNEALRYHDLRHSALTLLAATGATVAELQAHAGHASPAAALRYQHATTDRARTLADLVEKAIAADTPPAAASVRAMDARWNTGAAKNGEGQAEENAL